MHPIYFYIILFFIIGFHLLGVLYAFTQAHEEAHTAICKKFGGEIVGEKISLIEESYIQCKVNKTSEYYLAQSMVEAFGYQLRTLLTTIFILLWMIIVILIINMHKKQL